MFVGGALSQYLGAALAVSMFGHIGVGAVAWARVGAAAVILGILLRREVVNLITRHFALVLSFGLVLAGMNYCFYLALDRLPLGNAVAIEFLGPVAVTIFGTRSIRGVLVAVMAVSGVVALSDISSAGSLEGVAFAGLAGLFWAGYIVLGARVAATAHSTAGLGASLLLGSLFLTPIGVISLQSYWPVGIAVIAGAACTGVLSNVIPYSIDQIVLQSVSRVRFAVLQAILPATATVVGVVALAQIPSAREALGIVLITGALLVQPAPEHRLV